MKVVCYDCKKYDTVAFEKYAKDYPHVELVPIEVKLDKTTAYLAEGCKAVCVFVHDDVNREVLQILTSKGVEMLALRCAGFNNIDLKAAKELGIKVISRVPAYSPYSVAEHAMALIMAANRKIHKAYHRVKEGDFSIRGLQGFDMYKKVVGIMGTGKIGELTAGILKNGFQCEVIAYDIYKNPNIEKMGIPYVSKEEIFQKSDIISLHVPLNKDTKYMINADAINMMKPNVMIVNTSRGAIIDTKAVIEGLKRKKIGSLAIDVYEFEDDFFYEDRSDQVIHDDTLMRLLTFPNVVVTSHQAYFTEEAMKNISESVLKSLEQYATGAELDKTNIVSMDQ